jgi:hypothetical protein
MSPQITHVPLFNVYASVQAPAWLHPITDLQTAASIEQLQGMITHPNRYDYTYLAAALHRLSELTEQQRQLAAPAADDPAAVAARAELAVGNRLAKKLYGRLQQLAQDGSAAELACVLAAAARLGTSAGETYAAAATAFANRPQLQQASDTQLAAVMYAVATYSSSCTAQGVNAQASGFPKQQQHAVLKACATQVLELLRQQPQHAAGASGAAAAAAADAAGLQPSTVVMTVWALATARVKVPKATASKLFGVLGQPSIVAKLTGGGSSSGSSGRTTQQQQQSTLEEVARTCCTVLWAAAQLQYLQPDMSLAKAYVDGFMRALPAVPVACSSITTVLQSLASLLAAARQQQQQYAAAEESDYWRSVFLRCSDEVVRRLQQQQQATSADRQASSSSSTDSEGAAATAAADAGLCAASAAYQVVWAYHVAGIKLPGSQLQTLLALLGDQVSSSTALL